MSTKRNVRMRREYLYKKQLESNEAVQFDKKKKLKQVPPPTRGGTCTIKLGRLSCSYQATHHMLSQAAEGRVCDPHLLRTAKTRSPGQREP